MSEKVVQANLRLIRLEPWSVLKTGFLISVSIAITIVTATVIFWIVLAGMGVFDSIDQLLGDLTGSSAGLTETFSLPVVFVGSIAVAAFEIIVTTALTGLFAFIFNLTVPFSDGLELTLAEDRIERDRGGSDGSPHVG